MDLLRFLITNDAGISAVEYAVMLSLIGMGLMAAVLDLGASTANRYNETSALFP